MVGTRLAGGIFRLVAKNEEASDLVSDVQRLKRGALVATVLSLALPLAGIGLWQKFGTKSFAVTLASNVVSIGLAEAAVRKQKAVSGKQEAIKDRKELEKKREKQRLVYEMFPETIKPVKVSGIGGQVQAALQTQGIEAFVSNVVDAPAFYRVKLSLLHGATIHDIRKIEAKIRSTLQSLIPVTVVEQGDCDCAVEVPKADRDRRFVQLEKYLVDGFHPSGTPLTWPAGIDANNELLTVKILDPNYIHPLLGGGTGSGKSQLLLSWVRWLLQWQPCDVQIALIDPKHVTFGQLESLGRIGNIAATMGVSEERAEELFPEDAEADRFAERLKPWLPFGVVKDPAEAIKTYARMTAEMQRRYLQFRKWGVQDVEGYNRKMTKMGMPTMPVWVVITDEYYMQVSGKKFKDLTEEQLKKLGAMARAAGISMVIATQRPDYKTVDLGVRDNCMWRYSLRVQGNSGAIVLGLMDDDGTPNPTKGLNGKGDAICWYDGRMERVQGLQWAGSLPAEPTLFAAPLPEPGSQPVEREESAENRPAAKSKSVVSQGESVEPEPASVATELRKTEQQVKAAQVLYRKYRESREAGESVHSFFVSALGRKSYSPEFKQKFYEMIGPGLVVWITELNGQKGEDGDALLLPDQIVSRVFGTGFPPPAKNKESHAEYLKFANAVIEHGDRVADE